MRSVIGFMSMMRRVWIMNLLSVRAGMLIMSWTGDDCMSNLNRNQHLYDDYWNPTLPKRYLDSENDNDD